jgi:hypothetical protein
MVQAFIFGLIERTSFLILVEDQVSAMFSTLHHSIRLETFCQVVKLIKFYPVSTTGDFGTLRSWIVKFFLEGGSFTLAPAGAPLRGTGWLWPPLTKSDHIKVHLDLLTKVEKETDGAAMPSFFTSAGGQPRRPSLPPRGELEGLEAEKGTVYG